MDMEVGFIEEVLFDPQKRGPGPDIGKRRGGRLLHDVAQLPGEPEVAVARHPQHLDEQDVAAAGGPGEPRGHAGLRVLQGGVPEELGRPQVLGHVPFIDRHLGLEAFGDLPGRAPAQRGDFPLQVAQPRLPGVGGDDQAHRGRG